MCVWIWVVSATPEVASLKDSTVRTVLRRLEEKGFLTHEVRDRAYVYKPTEAPLGRHALIAVTAERDGLYVSMTRLVSFGPPPEELERLTAATAEIDAAFLAASRPGTTLGEVFAAGAEGYAAQGFPEEWRRHHQGGLTGYRGREVFATPGEPTPIPAAAALAWNPSIGGGAKSEDTILVTAAGAEVITRTEDLGELETAGLPRPAIVCV